MCYGIDKLGFIILHCNYLAGVQYISYYFKEYYHVYLLAEGTKDTATSFVKAGAGAVGDIVDATKSGAGAVVDGTKSGAKFVVNTTGKAVDKVEEELRQMAIAAVSAANDGAQYAGYGKQPGVLYCL